MDKWENIPLEEQETIINVDYDTRQVEIYTSRKNTANKLLKIYKDSPNKIIYKNQNGIITGIRIKKSFYDKDTARIFSKTLLISQLKPR